MKCRSSSLFCVSKERAFQDVEYAKLISRTATLRLLTIIDLARINEGRKLHISAFAIITFCSCN